MRLTRDSLSRIRTCAVFVKQEEGFSVWQERERMSGGGAYAGGLLGLAIEASSRDSHDTRLTKDLALYLGDFDAAKVFRQKLRNDLETAGVFSNVLVVDGGDKAALLNVACDGLLETTITQWGLVLCANTTIDGRMQTVVGVHQRLSRVPDGRLLWERDDFYQNGNCCIIGDYRTKPQFLVNELTGAIDNVVGRTVNELRYPQTVTQGDTR